MSPSKLWDTGKGTGRYSVKGVKESTLVNNMKKAVLQKYPDAVILKFHGSLYTASGVPDLIINVDRTTIYVEVKRPGGDTTPLQQVFLFNLRKIHVPCAVVDNILDLMETIQNALDIIRSEK